MDTRYNWNPDLPSKKTLKLRYQISQMDFHKIPVLGRDTFTGEMSHFFLDFRQRKNGRQTPGTSSKSVSASAWQNSQQLQLLSKGQ